MLESLSKGKEKLIAEASFVGKGASEVFKSSFIKRFVCVTVVPVKGEERPACRPALRLEAEL